MAWGECQRNYNIISFDLFKFQCFIQHIHEKTNIFLLLFCSFVEREKRNRAQYTNTYSNDLTCMMLINSIDSCVFWFNDSWCRVSKDGIGSVLTYFFFNFRYRTQFGELNIQSKIRLSLQSKTKQKKIHFRMHVKYNILFFLRIIYKKTKAKTKISITLMIMNF